MTRFGVASARLLGNQVAEHYRRKRIAVIWCFLLPPIVNTMRVVSRPTCHSAVVGTPGVGPVRRSIY